MNVRSIAWPETSPNKEVKENGEWLAKDEGHSNDVVITDMDWSFETLADD